MLKNSPFENHGADQLLGDMKSKVYPYDMSYINDTYI